MGAALFVVLDREVDGLDTFINGKALSSAEATLSNICLERRLKDLWSFFSANPEAEAAFFADEGIDAADITPGEPEQWFEPAEGLSTVRGLLGALETDGAGLQDASSVAEDLRDLERVLVGAEAGGAKWHLAVDF